MAIPPIIVISKVPMDCLSVFFLKMKLKLKLLTALILKKYASEDELEAYLVCPDEAKETDILMWRKTKSTWPKLQLMARQYLATTASWGGMSV